MVRGTEGAVLAAVSVAVAVGAAVEAEDVGSRRIFGERATMIGFYERKKQRSDNMSFIKGGE